MNLFKNLNSINANNFRPNARCKHIANRTCPRHEQLRIEIEVQNCINGIIVSMGHKHFQILQITLTRRYYFRHSTKGFDGDSSHSGVDLCVSHFWILGREVTCIPKAMEPSHSLPKNYRPISLSIFLLKPLKRLIDVKIKAPSALPSMPA